jgi:DNA-binding protein H-NS
MGTPTLSDLLAQKAAIERQIAETQQAQRADAVAKVKALMAEHGLTMADLTSRGATTKRAGKAGGGKVAVKYRNAATGDTWTGRGLQPKWLKAALESGRKLTDFAV